MCVVCNGEAEVFYKVKKEWHPCPVFPVINKHGDLNRVCPNCEGSGSQRRVRSPASAIHGKCLVQSCPPRVMSLT